MDQPISNTAPQGDPVAEAIARRGMGGQQAPMMSQGATMPPSAPSAPQAPQTPPNAPAQGNKFIPKDGHEFLLTTLNETLKNDYKLQSEKTKFGAPQQAPLM